MTAVVGGRLSLVSSEKEADLNVMIQSLLVSMISMKCLTKMVPALMKVKMKGLN